MKKAAMLGSIGGIIAAGAAAIFAYNRFVRPWHLRWGATDEELNEALAGDEVLPGADNQVTHAITINAAPQKVWEWLVQIGQNRGGFFSYDWIENLFDLQVKTADEIIPAYQHLKVGDFVRSAHRGWLGGRFDETAGWFVVGLEKNRSLVLRDEIEHGSWAFTLKPIGENRTRLIVRARGKAPKDIAANLFLYGFWEPAHFIMERKMLLTLKERAEKWASIPPEKAPDMLIHDMTDKPMAA
jgi:hypothetical protein